MQRKLYLCSNIVTLKHSKPLGTAPDTPLVIALDTMGGDHAPRSVLAGANTICARYSNVTFILYGNETLITPVLDTLPTLKQRSRIVHTSNAILSDDKPSAALRQGKDSSMRLAIDAVKNGTATAMVSAGNTGALMAMAKIVLRTLEGIDRPAIITTIPTLKGKTVMLDLGANVECNADNLFQFALMGDAFARVTLGLESPTIGLLNVGSEDTKGNDTVKAAAAMLKETSLPLNFTGYVEGTDIAEGTVDVVVTDGFTGNIALKTAEGTAKMCRDFLKEAFGGSLLSKLGYLLARPSLKRAFNRLDNRLYNGAMLVGLNGIVVKSHGGTDAIGFEHAISVAIELALHGINDKITEEVHLSQHVTVPLPSDDTIKTA
jgi:phosphate acyltransferase